MNGREQVAAAHLCHDAKSSIVQEQEVHHCRRHGDGDWTPQETDPPQRTGPTQGIEPPAFFEGPQLFPVHACDGSSFHAGVSFFAVCRGCRGFAQDRGVLHGLPSVFFGAVSTRRDLCIRSRRERGNYIQEGEASFIYPTDISVGGGGLSSQSTGERVPDRTGTPG